jgi:hypothetical protein
VAHNITLLRHEYTFRVVDSLVSMDGYPVVTVRGDGDKMGLREPFLRKLYTLLMRGRELGVSI